MSRLENIYTLLECYQENIWLDQYLRPTTNDAKKAYYIICEIDGNTEQLQRRDDLCTLFFICENLNKEELFLKITLTPLGSTEANVTQKVSDLCGTKSPNLIQVYYTKTLEYLKHQVDFMLMKYEQKYGDSMKALYDSIVDDDEEFLTTFEVLIFQLSHGLSLMHQNYLQHRDVKAHNLCIGKATHRHLQYIIDGIKFKIPAQINGFSCVLKIMDFGLSHDSLNPFAPDDFLNNTEPSLSPNFVFFDHTKDLHYFDSDEIFSAGMCLLTSMTNFQIEPLDLGVRREIVKFYAYQKEGGSPSVHTHLNSRKLERITYQAFRLVVLLGYPKKEEMPEFYQSLVGRAMWRIRPYLTSFPNYNYLRRHLDQSCIYTKALRRMLRWKREDRVESFKHLLLSDLFQHYRTDNLDPQVPIYDNSKPI